MDDAARSQIRLGSVSLDCEDPRALGDFWAGLLDGEVAFASDGFVAVRIGGLWLSMLQVAGFEAPTWPEGERPKQIHLDLAVDDLVAAEAVAVGLGASRAAHQPGGDRFVVLLDPAGHPFCLSTQIPE